jgi:hypothetical protein
MPDEREAARLTDYDRTVATVHQLTEVRFKLAAFLPALTGGAVALLASSKLGPLTKASLALGGLIFSLGKVLYDLRNSQIYNAAIGRAKALEVVLGFDVCEDDENPGLFGSRADTIRRKQEKGLDRFLRMPVQHGSGLALVYTAVIGAWLWAVLQQAAIGLQELHSHGWLRTAPHLQWIALGAAMASTCVVFRSYRRHDPPRKGPAAPVPKTPDPSTATAVS